MIVGLGLMLSVTSIVIINADVIGTDRVKVIDSLGSLQKLGNVGNDWFTVGVDEFIPASSIIRTGEYAAALLRLNGNNSLRMGENTTIELKTLGVKDHYRIRLITGKIWTVVNGKPSNTTFEVATPKGVIVSSSAAFAVFSDVSGKEIVTSLVSGSIGVAKVVMRSINGKGNAWALNRDKLTICGAELRKRYQTMWSYMRIHEGWSKDFSNLRLDNNFEVKCRYWFAKSTIPRL